MKYGGSASNTHIDIVHSLLTVDVILISLFMMILIADSISISISK